MSEVLTTGAGSMYDEVPAIRDLNKVEGFDPRKYMRVISEEGKTGKYYLDVAFRKLWFRLKHPEGKIVKQLVYRTDQMAIVEARVYLNRNDAEDNFIANAFAHKYLTEDTQFGDKFVELAETAAVGRALADAGFGLQFADREGDMDPEVTDAPFDAGMVLGNQNMGSLGAGEATEESSNTPIPEAARPSVQKPSPQPMKPAPSPQTIQKDMPVEQIYSMLTPETAAAVVIGIGFHKGKTLGQVAIEKPSSLEWYVSSYGGPDNLLRAAAKYLMDTALQKAS
ncbi:MAG: hypothetical protein IKA09_08815 [Lachnospiraceae bacterium]|nr:hypothetical protein [Lachnospiraceae bacterium]